MTIVEAAEMIGVSREYIRQLIHAKKIKAQLSGSIWIINKASLMKFKAQREASAA
jgi:excisionase family DNA binding protein